MNHKEHKEHKEQQKHQGHEPIASATEQIVREIIGAGVAVHRELGPGFIETVYGRALILELGHRSLRSEVEKPVQIHHRGELVCSHRLDLVVEGVVVVEVKAVRKLRRIHHAQILSYLKASGVVSAP